MPRKFDYLQEHPILSRGRRRSRVRRDIYIFARLPIDLQLFYCLFCLLSLADADFRSLRPSSEKQLASVQSFSLSSATAENIHDALICRIYRSNNVYKRGDFILFFAPRRLIFRRHSLLSRWKSIHIVSAVCLPHQLSACATATTAAAVLLTPDVSFNLSILIGTQFAANDCQQISRWAAWLLFHTGPDLLFTRQSVILQHEKTHELVQTWIDCIYSLCCLESHYCRCLPVSLLSSSHSDD